jgi:hypothetical protein
MTRQNRGLFLPGHQQLLFAYEQDFETMAMRKIHQHSIAAFHR